MKKKLCLILCAAVFLMACDDRLRQRDTDLSCKDPIADHNPNRLTFQNTDQRPIYLLVGTLNSGDQSSTLTTRAEIPARGQFSLPFNNQAFNHYYLYRDPNRQQFVAALIIMNTQPNNVCLAPIQLTVDGNFSASQQRVQNLRNAIAIREITLPTWQNWDGEYPSSGSRHELQQCGQTLFRTTASGDFRHAYFYQHFAGGTSYPFSQVIYRNTNTSKIQFNSIVVK